MIRSLCSLYLLELFHAVCIFAFLRGWVYVSSCVCVYLYRGGGGGGGGGAGGCHRVWKGGMRGESEGYII